MSYVNVKVTEYNPRILSYPIGIYTEVTMSEYWNLLDIPFIQERFMKHSIIYVKTAAELIEVSECANIHQLHLLLGGLENGALQAYIIPKEEPIFYK